MNGRPRRPILAALALLAAACADPGLARRPEAPAPLRIGTTLDYAPFSFGTLEAAQGFDLELVQRFARERDHDLVLVPVRWPELASDLAAGRFDVALGGVTVRPDRSLVGRFTAPLAETGAVVLVPVTSALRKAADLDRAGVRIAVNAGGHLERVARTRFPRAHVTAAADNAAVPVLLARGQADAVLTDSAEAPRWRAGLPPTRTIGPLTHDRKAWLVAPDRAELARAMDEWLADRETDGALPAARERWLGVAGAATASSGPALVAAIDERLALMPRVAEAKARAGLAVTDPSQEERVLAAGRAAVAQAAAEMGRPAPPDAAVDRLFRVLIAAASEVQAARLATLAGSPPPEGPDLERELRPAIARISERVARGLVVLAGSDAEPAALRKAVREGVRSVELEPATRDRIADAIAACASREGESR